jgi:hypothetical protein
LRNARQASVRWDENAASRFTNRRPRRPSSWRPASLLLRVDGYLEQQRRPCDCLGDKPEADTALLRTTAGLSNRAVTWATTWRLLQRHSGHEVAAQATAQMDDNEVRLVVRRSLPLSRTTRRVMSRVRPSDSFCSGPAARRSGSRDCTTPSATNQKRTPPCYGLPRLVQPSGDLGDDLASAPAAIEKSRRPERRRPLPPRSCLQPCGIVASGPAEPVSARRRCSWCSGAGLLICVRLCTGAAADPCRAEIRQRRSTPKIGCADGPRCPYSPSETPVQPDLEGRGRPPSRPAGADRGA